MSKAKIATLEQTIKLCNYDIEDNDENDEAHYQKASALVQLGKELGAAGGDKFIQALESYDKAIDLTKAQNSLYLADRGKLHVDMGRSDLAVKDILEISKLPLQAGIQGMYIGNTVKNIARLDEIQSSINKLKDSGKIDPELAQALNDHAKITQTLVVQVDKHDASLTEHNGRIAYLEKVVQELIAHGKISDESIEKLGIKVEKHAQILESLSLEAKSMLNEEITKLKQDSPEAYEYYGKFYWTLMHTFEASGVIGSGLVQSKDDAGLLAQSKLLNAGLEAVGGKVANYTNALFSGIPLIGSVVNILSLAVGDAYSAYKSIKFDGSISAMNRVITSKFGSKEEMSFAIAKVAFELAKDKKDHIEENIRQLTQDQSTIGWIQSVIDRAKKSLGNVELYDTPAAKLAFQDTVLLILHLQAKYAEIEQSQEPFINQLIDIVKVQPALNIITHARSDSQISANIASALNELDTQNGHNELATEAVSTSSGKEHLTSLGADAGGQLNSPQRSTGHLETKEPEGELPGKGANKCILMKVQVNYDNPVLKHSEVLQQLLRAYGSRSVDKLIEFGIGFKTADEVELIDDILSGETAFEDSIFLLGLDEIQHSAI